MCSGVVYARATPSFFLSKPRTAKRPYCNLNIQNVQAARVNSLPMQLKNFHKMKKKKVFSAARHGSKRVKGISREVRVLNPSVNLYHQIDR